MKNPSLLICLFFFAEHNLLWGKEVDPISDLLGTYRAEEKIAEKSQVNLWHSLLHAFWLSSMDPAKGASYTLTISSDPGRQKESHKRTMIIALRNSAKGSESKFSVPILDTVDAYYTSTYPEDFTLRRERKFFILGQSVNFLMRGPGVIDEIHIVTWKPGGVRFGGLVSVADSAELKFWKFRKIPDDYSSLKQALSSRD